MVRGAALEMVRGVIFDFITPEVVASRFSVWPVLVDRIEYADHPAVDLTYVCGCPFSVRQLTALLVGFLDNGPMPFTEINAIESAIRPMQPVCDGSRTAMISELFQYGRSQPGAPSASRDVMRQFTAHLADLMVAAKANPVRLPAAK